MSRRSSPVIPGFGLTLGYTLVYLSLLVFLPLAGMFILCRAIELVRVLRDCQRATRGRSTQA